MTHTLPTRFSPSRRFPNRPLALLFVAAMLGAPSWARDKGDDDTRALTLKTAVQGATDAEEDCASRGYRVSVAVVDRNGLVKAHIRGDGSGPHTLDSARKKAYTSASLGRSTAALVETVINNPAAEGLRDMNENILILAGGLPIIVDGEIIGGIGVGGAPSGLIDEACAQAGLDRIVHHY